MASQYGIEQIFDPLGALLSLGGGGGIMGSLPLLHVRDQKADTTLGGAAATGATRYTRTLNTVVTNEIAGASLASNKISLDPGDYFIMAWAPARKVDGHRITLVDVTGAAVDVLAGSNALTSSLIDTDTHAFLTGKFTVATASDFEIQHFILTANATANALGSQDGEGSTVEVYTQVLIWKTDVGGVLHVRDEKAAATDGGGSAAATWNARTLNTVVKNTIAGASLSSSQITLPAGDYRIQARAPAVFVDRHKIRVRQDVTGTPTTLIVGSSAFSDDAGATNSTDSTLDQIVTLAGTDVLDVQHYTEKAKVTNGLGQSTNAGEVEVYAEVFIERLN